MCPAQIPLKFKFKSITHTQPSKQLVNHAVGVVGVSQFDRELPRISGNLLLNINPFLLNKLLNLVFQTLYHTLFG